MLNNRDVLEMMELIVCNNTPEQIKQAEEALPDKDDIQKRSFEVLKQFIEQRK